jgi:hypothetical protein
MIAFPLQVKNIPHDGIAKLYDYSWTWCGHEQVKQIPCCWLVGWLVHQSAKLFKFLYSFFLVDCYPVCIVRTVYTVCMSQRTVCLSVTLSDCLLQYFRVCLLQVCAHRKRKTRVYTPPLPGLQKTSGQVWGGGEGTLFTNFDFQGKFS